MTEAEQIADLTERVEALERVLTEHLAPAPPVHNLEARHQRFRARLESRGEEL